MHLDSSTSDSSTQNRGIEMQDGPSAGFANTKAGDAAARLHRLLEEEMDMLSASWLEVCLRLKGKLEQGLMRETVQSNSGEAQSEDIALLDTLDGLIKMFEEQGREEGGVALPITADEAENHLPGLSRPFQQRGLWAGRNAADGTRYWKKDGHGCLVSPRCHLHGGTNGYCSGDELQAKLRAAGDSLASIRADGDYKKETEPQKYQASEKSRPPSDPSPKMKLYRSRRGRTYLAPDKDASEEATEGEKPLRQANGGGRRKTSQWNKVVLADGTPYWKNVHTKAQCWSKPRCVLHDQNGLSTLPPCRAPQGHMNGAATVGGNRMLGV